MIIDRVEFLELRRAVAAMVRTGVVNGVSGKKVTVKYDSSGLTSRPMPYLIGSAAIDVTPIQGDQVIVFSPGGLPAQAIALCGISSTDADKGSKTPAARSDLVKQELDGIKSDLNVIKSTFDAHGHGGNGASPPATGLALTYNPASPESNNVKVD